MQPSSLLGNESLFVSTLTALVRAIPMLYLQLTVLALWIFLFFYLKKMLKQKRRLLVALLFCLLASSGLILVFKHTLQSRVYLKTTTKCAVYSGPGVNFTVLGHLPAGEELIKLQENGSFAKARYKGIVVWIGVDNVSHLEQNK